MQKRSKDWLIILLPAIVSLAVFLPSLRNGFVAWDDNRYVYENPAIRLIDLNFIKLVFTSVVGHTDHWHPLTILSYAVDYRIWKLNPFGYHLTSIVLNSINTALLALVTLKLCELSGLSKKRSALSALIAALFFSIHPLHVESVTWVSGRKDLLCVFFLFVSVIAYLNYATSDVRRRSFYALSLVFFFFALMSKSTAVTLPAILLIIDFFALKRFDNKQNTIRAIVEKIPYAALSALLTLFTVVVFKNSEAWRSLAGHPIGMRIFTSLRGYVFYLYKVILPVNLTPFYPYPADMDYSMLIGSLAVLSSITILCMVIYKRQKLPLAIWIYYLITLLPVIGIIQIGDQGAADRYIYMPSIGIAILVGCAGAFMFERLDGVRHKTAIIVTAALLTVLAVITMRQQAVWKDTLSLWSREIEVYPMKVPLSYTERGLAYQKIGNLEQAMKDFNTAIMLSPETDMIFYFNRAGLFRQTGDFARALADYDRAARMDPTHANTFYNRGFTYQAMGEFDKAIADFGVMLAKDPSFGNAYVNRGVSYAMKNDSSKAIEDFTKAIGLIPNDSVIYQYRGTALLQSGLYERAISDLKTSVSLNPQNALAYYNLSLAYTRLNDNPNAAYNMRIAANLGLSAAIDALQAR